MINIFKLLPIGDWIWIGAAVALWGYHEYDKHEAVARARTEITVAYETKITAANAQAKADHDALQAQVDAKANTSNAALAQTMAAINAKLAKLGTVYHPTTALPAGCRFDADRVTQANKALE